MGILFIVKGAYLVKLAVVVVVVIVIVTVMEAKARAVPTFSRCRDSSLEPVSSG
jgi:hypothetical protein